MADNPEQVHALQRDARKLLLALSSLPKGPQDAPSLDAALERAKAYLARRDKTPPPPVRSLHHFACTGGTLISKALAAMPNTVVLSEIDPLSTLHLRARQQPFFPTDMTPSLRFSPRMIGDDTILAMFRAALCTLRDDLTRRGCHLVLRDHAHSQFCTMQDRHARPTLHKIVSDMAPVRGVVTVRHPLESLLSLRHMASVHHTPDTLEEYCLRYRDFLEAHHGLPIVKYETFVARPMETAEELCTLLDLPFEPDFEIVMPLAHLSGDSGRSGNIIRPRPRRPVPESLWREAEESESYRLLCESLGYERSKNEQADD